MAVPAISTRPRTSALHQLQQNRRTFTNYKKADWTQFTHDTEFTFTQTTISTNIIMMVDKQNIPKGKIHRNCGLLPDQIVCKITQRNNMRRANTCDPALRLLNEEITSDIHRSKGVQPNDSHARTITVTHCDNHKVHCKLHQLTQSLHNIQKPHIHKSI